MRDRRLERVAGDGVCKDGSGGYSPAAIGESPLSQRFRMPM